MIWRKVFTLGVGLLQHFVRAIVGTVVDEDYFRGGLRLCEHRVQRARQRVRTIAGRYNDRNFDAGDAQSSSLSGTNSSATPLLQ